MPENDNERDKDTNVIRSIDESYKQEIEKTIFLIDKGEVPIHVSVSKAQVLSCGNLLISKQKT